MRRMASTGLLTTAQTAEALGVSVATVHRFESEGLLPLAVKVEGLRGPKLFARADVERLAAERAEVAS